MRIGSEGDPRFRDQWMPSGRGWEHDLAVDCRRLPTINFDPSAGVRRWPVVFVAPESLCVDAMNTSTCAAQPLMPSSRHRTHSGKAAPFLPMSRAEMTALGWDACDNRAGDRRRLCRSSKLRHGHRRRLLEAQGFRVGIIAQPDWQSAEPFKALGKPRVFFGVTGGNMDSMVNRYTADRRLRHDDAYTPGGEGGRRPDRCTVVYAQRCREAFKDVPIVLGGIEASLRRIAHFDYWSEKVRRSVLADAKADLLLYGNAERAVVEVAHRLAAGEAPRDLDSIRGVALFRPRA